MKKLSVPAVPMILAILFSALQGPLHCGNLFTLEMPISWQDFGVDSSGDDETYYDLGMIGGYEDTSLNMAMSLYYFEQYAGLRLFDETEKDIEAFAQTFDFGYDSVQLQEVRTVSEYDIPFIVYAVEDQGDPMISAVTFSNGWCIEILGYAYADDSFEACRPLTGEDVRQFYDVLDSFEPILKGSTS